MAGDKWGDLSKWARGERERSSGGGTGKGGDKSADGSSGTPPQSPPPEPSQRREDGTHRAPDVVGGAPSSPVGPSSNKAQSQGSIRDAYRSARDQGKEQLKQKGSDAVADKIGLDREVVRNLTKSKDENGEAISLGKRAGAAVEAGVSAGLVYVGVPPEVSKRLSPILMKVTAGVLAFMLLIVVGAVGGIGFSRNGDLILPNEAYEEVNEDVRREAVIASITYQVPVRVLLAIAGVQTSYGRYSPYDDIDRDPLRQGFAIVEKRGGRDQDVAVYPSAVPAIGNAGNPDEGVGMFLVRPGAAKRAGVDPQDVRRTAQWLARLMREEANRLKRGGVVQPLSTSDNYAAADEFWGKVVSTLPLVDVFGQNVGCAVPSGVERVDTMISLLWSCELDRVANIAIPSVSSAGATPVLSYDTNSQSASRLIREALGVAWQWGQYKQPAADWAAVSALPCNNRAELAGVFPLSRRAATDLGVEDRCDNAKVIDAVAKHVLGALSRGESSVTLDPARPWAVEATGWDILPWALGDEETRNRFAETGRQSPYDPSAQCRNITYDYLATLSNSNVLRQPFLEVAEAVSEADRDAAKVKARAVLLISGNGNPYVDVRCSSNRRAPLEADWLAYTATLSGKLVSALEEGLKTSRLSVTPPESVVLHVISEFSGGGASSEVRTAVPGIDAAIERLSPDSVAVDMPPADAGSAGSSSFSLWSRILDETLRLGGILRGDPRNGKSGSSAGGFGIAIRRVDPSSIPVIEKFSDGGLVEGIRCASSGETPVMTSEYALRWTALCNAAQAAGVELSVNSSWRSNDEQYTIWKRYGDALAARPGSSNHQKGFALDLEIGVGSTTDDHNGSQSPAFSFLHSVVGCLDEARKSFDAFSSPLQLEDYIAKLDAGKAPCSAGLLPIKRVQTFGLVPLCTVHNGEDWADRAVLLCSKQDYLKGSGTHREAWHMDYGVIFLQTSFSADCDTAVTLNPTDKRSVALAVKSVWFCELQGAGFTSLATVDGPKYPAGEHFANLAEQVSSEAVVVAYCESGFNASSQSWAGYTGVFQMGEWEMETYGGGTSRVDAMANIRAAARYFIASYKQNQGLGWAGWGPWAVVNTDYWETNRAVSRPVIGRWPSTNPDAEGQYGPDLPNWAIDPSGYWGPEQGCSVAYSGKEWAPAPAAPMKR